MSNSISRKLRAVRIGIPGVTGIGRSLSAAIVISLLCCALTALVAHAYYSGGTTDSAGFVRPHAASSLRTLSRPATNLAAQQGERVETELISITPDGIQPKEIKRPKGRFFLALENRTGLRDVSLRLDREGGSRFIDAPMLNGKLILKYSTDLPPGVYRLTEASHGDWACRVTITE
jgi:hypothetical protein